MGHWDINVDERMSYSMFICCFKIFELQNNFFLIR